MRNPPVTKQIIVPTGLQAGFAGTVRAAGLLFVSGCDGHRDRVTGEVDPELAAQAEQQCENAYGGVEDLLRGAGATMSDVVRLDHMTSSQDWLPRRQSVRGRIFGKPAPLSSTGVAAKMHGINMLTAYAIAVSDPNDKEILVPGPRYGMENISSAVRGGSFVFISGIRGTLDPRSGRRISEERAGSFEAQTRVCYEIIADILSACRLKPTSLLRIDSYLRNGADAPTDTEVRGQVLGAHMCATTQVALPLSARGEIEVTALAAAPSVPVETRDAGGITITSAGGLAFVGACDGVPLGRASGAPASSALEDQIDTAVDKLSGCLMQVESQLSNVVRIELFVRDIYNGDAAARLLQQRIGKHPPAIAIIGAELRGGADVMLNAITV